MQRYFSQKNLIIAAGVIGILTFAVLLLDFFFHVSKIPQLSSFPFGFPAKITSVNYTDTMHHMTYMYPSSWTLDSTSAETNNTTRFSLVKNTPYGLVISPPRDGFSTEMGLVHADKVVQEDVTYGGFPYTRVTWYKNTNVYAIAVLAKNPDPNALFIRITLPPDNTQAYIQQFNQLLESIHTQ